MAVTVMCCWRRNAAVAPDRGSHRPEIDVHCVAGKEGEWNRRYSNIYVPNYVNVP